MLYPRHHNQTVEASLILFKMIIFIVCLLHFRYNSLYYRNKLNVYYCVLLCTTMYYYVLLYTTVYYCVLLCTTVFYPTVLRLTHPVTKYTPHHLYSYTICLFCEIILLKKQLIMSRQYQKVLLQILSVAE